MRFTLVSVALLVLAHPLAPGVHGAPAAPAVACGDVPLLAGLAKLLGGSVESLLEKLGLDLKDCSASGAPLLPRAVTSPALSASSAAHSSTTTNVSLPTTAASNPFGVSSQGGTTPVPLSRLRRQLPVPTPSLPINPTAAVASALSPVESILSSVLASLPSKAGSALNKPTSSKQSPSTSQA